MAGLVEQLKGFYYFFEDHYYGVLDRIDEYVPVYKAIDPIDEHFPSFILFLLLLSMFFVFLAIVISNGGEDPIGFLVRLVDRFLKDPIGFISRLLDSIAKDPVGFFSKLFGNLLKDPIGALGRFVNGVVNTVLSLLGIGAGQAKFLVIDNSNKPIVGVQVSLVAEGKAEERKTDTFGEFRTEFFKKNVDVMAKKEGYAEFKDKLNIEPKKKYTIKLQQKRDVTVKKIDYELTEEGEGQVGKEVDVSIEFSCSNGAAPRSISGKGPRHSVQAQTNCGLLTAHVEASGYEGTRKTVEVEKQQGAVSIALKKKKMHGALRVLVKDEDTEKPIEGVELLLKSGTRTVMRLGTTDATGSVLEERVPGGTYFVEATPPKQKPYGIERSVEFDIGAAEFSASGPKTIEVTMKKLSEAKKILMKFVDSSSKVVIKGVKAQLVISDVPSVENFSNNDGLVDFVNLDKTKKYAVIVSHPDYVLKVLSELKLIAGSDNTPTEVQLVKAVGSGPGSNSGKAKVIVSDFSGAKIANATVLLFLSPHKFHVWAGETNPEGISEFSNLPPGNYKASATKEINEVTYEGESQARELTAGSTIELPIALVTANGKLRVKVVDGSSGDGVMDANVVFVDTTLGNVAKAKTKHGGLTDAIEFKVDKRVYVVVEKEGYNTTKSVVYGVNPNSTKTIEVVLDKAGSSLYGQGDFDVRLVSVYDSSGAARANKLEAGKEYKFRFKLHVKKKAEDVKAIVRTGKDTEVNAEQSAVVVKGSSPSPFITAGAFSKCFDPNSIYSECQPLAPESGAKQAVLSFATLDADSAKDYEFEATAMVKQGTANGTTVELRYGGKGNVGGQQLFVIDEKTLKLKTFVLGETFCLADCALTFEAAFQDSEKKLVPEKKNIGFRLSGEKWEQTDSSFELLKGIAYTVDFNVFNASQENYQNVIMRLKSDNSALAFQQASVNVGSLGAGTKASGSFSFTAQNSSASTAIDMNLGLERKGDTARIVFKVLEDRQMVVELSPPALQADKENNNVEVKVSDSGTKAGIEGADISVFEHSNNTPISFQPTSNARTGQGGLLTITLPTKFSAATVLNVKARKTGYREATAQLKFSSQAAFLSGLECITDDEGQPLEGKYVLVQQRNGSSQFKLKNDNCGRTVNISFAKEAESDISLTYSGSQDSFDGTKSLQLANNETAEVTVKAGKVFGVQPVYITAKQPKQGGGFDSFKIGTVRAIVTNPFVQGGKKIGLNDSCLSSKRLTSANEPMQNQYTFEFDKAQDTVQIANKCFSGLEDTEESSNSVANRYPKYTLPSGLSVIESTYSKKLADRESAQDVSIRNTGLKGGQFFIITPEDYVNGGS